jgi:FkbM family methyltransferase
MPGSMKMFNKHRKKDINIEAVISDTKSEINYYSFKESALNTINTQLGEERKQQHKLLKIHKIKSSTLLEILQKYLPENTKIDFLTIDVEGVDFEVLKSNDWGKYQPKYVLIEIRNKNLNDILENPITNFLFDFGYEINAKTVNTVFFKLKI